MTLFADWLRICGLLVCCAAIALSTGCHSTNSSTNSAGVSQNKNGTSSLFGTKPPKPQTVQEFLSQPKLQ